VAFLVRTIKLKIGSLLLKNNHANVHILIQNFK